MAQQPYSLPGTAFAASQVFTQQAYFLSGALGLELRCIDQMTVLAADIAIDIE
jgi:hypothetical protein